MCCQPWATALPHQRTEASSPIPMRRANPVMAILPGCEEKRRTIRCASFGAETIRQSLAASSCEPLFKKRARLGAFHPASHRIHYAAPHGSITFIETKPIGKMQFTPHRSDLDTGVAQFEKSLLENDAQDFVAQKFHCALFGEGRWQSIARLQRQQFPFNRNAGKFEQVERAVDRIDGEKPRRCAGVLHAVQEIWNICVGDAPQPAAAHPPIKRGNPRAGKCPHGLFLSHVGLQSADGAVAYSNGSPFPPNGSKSKGPQRWPATPG